ncbi:tellurite resistance/C4-dicarboxylate transporter family protein [Microbacterium sp. STN6]|uniref:tellurite resistance/C4-dicarboxylate transporter family protein n=1 Tax=Microbacterium sp. STN6 TaxID=2995588 RepID=UPI002260FAE4|nr:tellurite resistance/C4-dicarboxylate transporter family protein [Microbacterium sp. STN6]MCX7522457.1 tellurite resistance/C4-dicarboxylate transporter family protein [Microbacterium sp. STN6]
MSGASAVASLREAVTRLPAGSFAFVMATGIVSTALNTVGAGVLSIALLVVAVVGGAALAIALAWRAAIAPARLRADVRSPSRAFGFLTIVAAVNVVAVRLHGADAAGAAIALTLLGVPLWLLLGYGVPATLILQRRTRSAVASADGSWFLWVVATQSVATAVGTVAVHDDAEFLAAFAVALWGIGVMLYLMLATLVILRLLAASASPGALNPSYWIYMGATAITVLAGSVILTLPSDLPIVAATRSVVSGLTYVLWAFGLWWIPLLVVFGVWRHAVRRVRLRYDTSLWSIVFPLGMFAVASIHFGRVEHLPLMVGLGTVGAGVAGIAWLLVFGAMAARAVRSLLRAPTAVG